MTELRVHRGDLVIIPKGTTVTDIRMSSGNVLFGPTPYITTFQLDKDLKVRLGLVGWELKNGQRIPVAHFGRAGYTYELDKINIIEEWDGNEDELV
jgi:hypothetical protein